MQRAHHKHKNQWRIKTLIQKTTMIYKLIHLYASLKESIISEQLKFYSLQISNFPKAKNKTNHICRKKLHFKFQMEFTPYKAEHSLQGMEL